MQSKIFLDLKFWLFYFFKLFSIMANHRILNIVPCAIQFIHSIYNSLHLLVPNSQFVASPKILKINLEGAVE